MLERIDVRMAGEPMQLLADRAMYWPARRRLIIADLHLGKGDTFRAAGISVPSGGTAHDLARLQHLLQATDAEALWILGDFLHAQHHAAVDSQWHAFLRRHAGLSVTVVLGNHDRWLAGDALDVETHAGPVADAPFVFQHTPEGERPAQGHIICGHLHPVLRLRGIGQTPVFWLDAGQCVLPAFSAFTGGYRLPNTAAMQCVACNGEALITLGDGTSIT